MLPKHWRRQGSSSLIISFYVSYRHSHLYVARDMVRLDKTVKPKTQMGSIIYTIIPFHLSPRLAATYTLGIISNFQIGMVG